MRMDTTQAWDRAQPADMSTDSSVLTMSCKRVRASARNRARHVPLNPPLQFTYMQLPSVLFPLLITFVKLSLLHPQFTSWPSLAAQSFSVTSPIKGHPQATSPNFPASTITPYPSFFLFRGGESLRFPDFTMGEGRGCSGVFGRKMKNIFGRQLTVSRSGTWAA